MYKLVRPLVHRLDPESAHLLALRVLELGLPVGGAVPADPALACEFLGMPLAHPIGLAAGFDKNARVASQCFGLGFSFVEIGGVTPLPQAGNPRPRVFRIPAQQAVINRMGFPNDGMQRVAERLATHRSSRLRPSHMLGVNIASNSDASDPLADFIGCARTFAPLCQYLALDVSCPNTQNGRLFLEPTKLRELLRAMSEIRTESKVAIVVKLSPDIEDSELAALLAVIEEERADAVCMGNTTMQRPGALGQAVGERGGLSGPPIFALSLEKLRFVRSIVADRIPLIAVGGIDSGAAAYEKIRAGASVLQIYTAMIYEGPSVVQRIARELRALLKRDGYSTITQAIGTSASR